MKAICTFYASSVFLYLMFFCFCKLRLENNSYNNKIKICLVICLLNFLFFNGFKNLYTIITTDTKKDNIC